MPKGRRTNVLGPLAKTLSTEGKGHLSIWIGWRKAGMEGGRKKRKKGVLLAIVAMMNWPIGRGDDPKPTNWAD